MSQSQVKWRKPPGSNAIRPARSVPAAAILMMAVLGAGAAQAAQTCSVRTDGKAAYNRVQMILKNKFAASPDVGLPSYDGVKVKQLANCTFELSGKFHFKWGGKVNFREFDARMARNSKAPGGFKKLKLVIHGG